RIRPPLPERQDLSPFWKGGRFTGKVAGSRFAIRAEVRGWLVLSRPYLDPFGNEEECSSETFRNSWTRAGAVNWHPGACRQRPTGRQNTGAWLQPGTGHHGGLGRRPVRQWGSRQPRVQLSRVLRRRDAAVRGSRDGGA